jgi:predicted Ser/Thr protein kinase
VTAATEDIRAWLQSRGDADGQVLGKGYQSWVYLYDTPWGKVVVKRAHPAPLMRWLGRLAIRHEQRVYERLAQVPGVPRSYGLLDPERLALEHIEGESLRQAQNTLADPEAFYARLRETIDAMHAAGISHGDLKRKYNILVGPDERPFVIDFGVARLRESQQSRFARWLYEWCRQTDYNAWIKMKYQRQLDQLSEDDRAIYRPLMLERLARAIRIPLRAITLRKLRKQWKRDRADRAAANGNGQQG